MERGRILTGSPLNYKTISLAEMGLILSSGMLDAPIMHP